MKSKLSDMELVQQLAEDIDLLGGKVYLVGGYVRDTILHRENKDLDIEVYGITVEQLKQVLSQYGEVLLNGASFAVYMIKGYDIDISVPRIERKSGQGHKGFDVQADPFLSTKEASKRRDFTINALLLDVLTGEIIDNWGGLEDLKNKEIRHINDVTFVEDSLRVYRAAQFASRLKFTIAPETIALSRQISLADLPKERVLEEFKKGLLKSDKPALFIHWLNILGVIDTYYPELAILKHTPQRRDYHPEGNVYNHTLLCLNQAVTYRTRSSNPLGFMLGCLLHDIGKATTTKLNENNIYSSRNHENAGVPIATEFLCKLTNETKLITFALNIVKYHMLMHQILDKKDTYSLIKMHATGIDVHSLIDFSLVDSLGRGGNVTGIAPKIVGWAMLSLEADLDKPFVPLVTGKDLGHIFKLKPGPIYKTILTKALDLQYGGKSREDILAHIARYYMPHIVTGNDLQEVFKLKPGPIYSDVLRYAFNLQLQSKSKEEILHQISIEYRLKS